MFTLLHRRICITNVYSLRIPDRIAIEILKKYGSIGEYLKEKIRQDGLDFKTKTKEGKNVRASKTRKFPNHTRAN